MAELKEEVERIEAEAIAENEQLAEVPEEGLSGEGVQKNMVLPSMHIDDTAYIKDRVDDQIAYYNSKSSKNQKKYKHLKRLEFILAALIPVVVTFSSMNAVTEVSFGENGLWGLDTIFNIVAALAGVLIVIINKQLDLEEHFKLWKEYRLTCEALQHERIMYLTRTDPYDEEDAFHLFVNKIESILNNETFKWKQQGKQQEQQNAKR